MNFQCGFKVLKPCIYCSDKFYKIKCHFTLKDCLDDKENHKKAIKLKNRSVTISSEKKSNYDAA